MIADRLTDRILHHGEGAVWHEPWGGLRFVDLLEGDVLFRDEATGRIDRMPTGSDVAALVRPRAGGGLVVAVRERFALFDAAGALEDSSRDLVPAGARFNEGAVDPFGRVLCGTIVDGSQPLAALWRLDADGTTTRVLDGITVSNGLGFTADDRRAFYVDSPTRRIDVFDVDDAGDLHGRRPFADTSSYDGFPDGVCVDVDGGVWVAFYGGSAVRRFDADGMLSEVVEVPDVTQVTSSAIGGANGTTLYITTSREHLAHDAQPAAGSLYTAEVGVRGVAVHEARI